MSKALLFTDPHLGISRTGNTTSFSAQALQQKVYDVAREIAQKAQAADADLICLGDLFDRHSNPERVILQGLNIAGACRFVLAGNHDQLNIAGSVGSLSLVHEALDTPDLPSPVIMNPDMSKPYSRIEVLGKTAFHFVPHALTQDLFEQSLKQACESAQMERQENVNGNVLMLHCNVGEAHGRVEAEGSTLALTDELQDVVLSYFDLVFVGHEHTPRKLKGGRIIVMGNTFPVSFGEISKRFVYWLDLDTGEVTEESLNQGPPLLHEIAHDDLEMMLLGGEFTNCPFVDISGRIKPEEYPAHARRLKKFWVGNPGVLMLRNGVVIDRAETAADQTESYADTRTLAQRVHDEAAAAGFAEELDELEAMP